MTSPRSNPSEDYGEEDPCGVCNCLPTEDFRQRMLELVEEYSKLRTRCMALDAMASSLDVVNMQSGSSKPPDDKKLDKVVSMRTSVSEIPDLTTSEGGARSRVSLAQIEEAQLRLRNCFRSGGASPSRKTTMNSSSRRTGQVSNVSQHASLTGSDGRICLHMHVLDPTSSTLRLVIDVLLFMVCIHDTAVVPVLLAWDPPTSVYTRSAGLLSLVLWTMDIVLNFFTGYVKEGMVITDFRAIAIRYLTTSFALDFSVTFVDLLSVVLDSFLANSDQDVTEVSSIAKVLRLMKLSKLARATILFRRWLRKVKLRSNTWTLLGLGGRLVAILIILNHLICCAWFWLGALTQSDDISDTDASWLDMKVTSGGLFYRDANREFQYLTAFHWSLTQMTPGSMSVVPQNSMERAWNIMVLLLGLFVSSLLISQLSAKMVRVQTLDHDRLCQIESLSRFLSEQAVPRSLAQRIQRQVAERASITKPLTIKNLPSLQHLPPTLLNELTCTIYAPSFLRHTVFFAWCIWDDSLILKLAKASELEAYSPDDEVFSAHQEAQKMSCVQSGVCRYTRSAYKDGVSAQVTGRTTGTSNDADVIELSPQAWASTIALWCHWNYQGSLMAVGAVQIVAMKAESVIAVLQRHSTILECTSKVAQAVSLMACAAENAHAVDLDIAHARVLMSMNLADRLEFSRVLMEDLEGMYESSEVHRYIPLAKSTAAQAELLSEELDAGKCVVTLGTDGSLLRTVLLCVLRISRRSGEMLYKIASCKKGELKPDCVPPGSKLRTGESTNIAAQRVVQEEMPRLNGSLQFLTSSDEEQVKRSAQYGVRTVYLKTVLTFSYEDSEPSTKDERSEAAGHLDSTCAHSGTNSSRVSKLASQRVFPTIDAMEVSHGEGKYELYAWLSTSEFAILSGSGSEEFKMWLREYHATRDEVSEEEQEQEQEQEASGVPEPPVDGPSMRLGRNSATEPEQKVGAVASEASQPAAGMDKVFELRC